MAGFQNNAPNFSKKSGSGLTFLFVSILALIVVWAIVTYDPIALDKEGATSIDSLFGINSVDSTNAVDLVSNDGESDDSSTNTDYDNTSSENNTVSSSNIVVYFCPQDNCASELVKRIDNADSSIYIAIFSFTLDNLSASLLKAKERGVDIKVVFDYDQSKNEYSEDELLLEAGIPIKRMDGSGYMHNKFTIIDGNIISTGSFNYSANADTRNNENLIFIESSELASQYKSDFDLLWEKAAK